MRITIIIDGSEHIDGEDLAEVYEIIGYMKEDGFDPISIKEDLVNGQLICKTAAGIGWEWN